jgi:chromosome segregation ATPase
MPPRRHRKKVPDKIVSQDKNNSSAAFSSRKQSGQEVTEEQRSSQNRSENLVAHACKVKAEAMPERIEQLERENSGLKSEIVTLQAELKEARNEIDRLSSSAGMQPCEQNANTKSVDMASWNNRIDTMQQKSREADARQAAAWDTVKSVLDDLHELAVLKSGVPKSATALQS